MAKLGQFEADIRHRTPQRVALKLGLTYIAVSTVWIIGSDWVVYDLLPITVSPLAQTLKGLTFVVLSGALIVFLAHHWTRALQKTAEKLDDSQYLARMGNFSWAVGAPEVFCSDGMRHLLNYDAGERIDIHQVQAEIHHPDDNDRVMNWINTGIESGASALGPETYRLVRKDGEVIWVEANIRIERARSGSATIFGTCLDITRRVEIEHALIDAKTRSEQAAKAKSVFLASISHELRTPLNAIIGFSDIIQSSAGDQLSPKQQEQLNHIHTAGNQLYGLVTDVLELTHAEQLDFRIEPASMSLREATETATAQVRFLAERHAVQVFDNLQHQEDVICFADSARVQQVLVNILSNAIKYNHPNGSVTIELGESKPGKVRLCITDTGRGIPDDEKASIFNIFKRLEDKALVAGEGIGVGLTITKSLVERMGGEIGVESVLGQGSTFWCEFPMV